MGSILSRLRITAVDGVSFDVGSAEIFGLAGESGCGKTTLSRMILGFEEPSSGAIIHRGKDGEPVSGKKVWRTAGVQAVFQNPFETFNPLRQVERSFFEAVHNYKLAGSKPEALERINSALEAVGMDYDGIAGRYPGEFSGGQLQRVSIARSLLTEPTLLIADEPVSMVDASIRMSIMNLFRELTQKFGVSVIYITHDLATAYYVCDRIGYHVQRKFGYDGRCGQCAGGAKASLRPTPAVIHPWDEPKEAVDHESAALGQRAGGLPAGWLQVRRQMP